MYASCCDGEALYVNNKLFLHEGFLRVFLPFFHLFTLTSVHVAQGENDRRCITIEGTWILFFRSTLHRIIRHMLKIPLEPLSYIIIRPSLTLNLATAHQKPTKLPETEKESLITSLRESYDGTCKWQMSPLKTLRATCVYHQKFITRGVPLYVWLANKSVASRENDFKANRVDFECDWLSNVRVEWEKFILLRLSSLL